MSTLKVTHLQNESNSAPSISISSAVGGGVTFAGISTFYNSIRLGTDIEGHTSADDLTIATSGDTGMTIRSGTSNQGSLYFSDATSGGGEYAGWLRYSHQDSNMTIGVAENEKLRITSAGLVGINQLTPTAFMHVKSGANDGTVISTFEGATNNKLDVKFVSTGPAINVTAGDPLVFELGGSEKLRITSAGSVGIGTNAPAGNFEVRGNDGINVSNATRIGTSGAQWRLIPHNGGGSATNLRLYEGAGGTEVLNIQKDGKIILMTGNGIQFGSNDSGGSVGSQTLDDYEEGVYDPTISFQNSGSATLNASFNTLTYIKIGRLVTINGQLRIASVSSPVGNMAVSLPFAVTSTTEKGRSGGALFWLDIGAGNGNYYKNIPYIVEESSTTLRVENLHHEGGVQFAASDEISFAVTYVAAS